ncbi:MAG: hypothetical protein RR891_02555 [Clostridium sp.]
MVNSNGALTEFIKDSRVLLDFSRCSVMATKYKDDYFNFRYYSIQLVNLEKKMMQSEDDVVAAVFQSAIEKYYDGIGMLDAVEQAIEDIKTETGEDPKEKVLKAIKRGD